MPMIRFQKYVDIRGGSIWEGASSTISANGLQT